MPSSYGALPYADADRLVMIWDDNSTLTGTQKFYSTPAEWHAWRRLNTVFTDIAATDPGQVTLSGDGEPEELAGRRVTGNFWTILGAQPILGRVFTEEEDTRGVRAAVIPSPRCSIPPSGGSYPARALFFRLNAEATKSRRLGG